MSSVVEFKKGERVGYWTVLKRARVNGRGNHSRWLCKCVCGEKRFVSGWTLNNGKSKSCGCMLAETRKLPSTKGTTRVDPKTRSRRTKDLTGRVFGRLTVLEFEEYRFVEEGHQSAYWRCKCECGKIVIIRAYSLTRGNTRSCGCLFTDTCRMLDRGHRKFANIPGNAPSVARRMYTSYRSQAGRRSLKFLVNYQQFMDLISGNCSYCGAPPLRKSIYQGEELLYNGIDRINNNTGYEPPNCVSCCTTCNKAKMTMTVVEFKEWIKRVYNHMHLGGRKIKVSR